ncbi:MAG: heavy-metal-associated domain-containing protein [Clostridia bacterium]|nr:heavy-metal-associated domain-containing protein [Clostridia bacterium]
MLFAKEKITTTLRVSGMACPKCAARVEGAVNALRGAAAKVDLAAATVTVTHPEKITPAMIAEAIRALGFGVEE